MSRIKRRHQRSRFRRPDQEPQRLAGRQPEVTRNPDGTVHLDAPPGAIFVSEADLIEHLDGARCQDCISQIFVYAVVGDDGEPELIPFPVHDSTCPSLADGGGP